jgi:hypothetical protein
LNVNVNVKLETCLVWSNCWSKSKPINKCGRDGTLLRSEMITRNVAQERKLLLNYYTAV